MNKDRLKKYSYGWFIVIILIVGLGVFFDFKSHSFQASYQNINIAIGPNETIQKTLVIKPNLTLICNILANFLYGLAVTLFATIFVARKLEYNQKKKYEEELEKLRDAVNINVFDALFKTLIPDEIFQIVKAEIIENKAIRKKAHWSFVFEEKNSKINMISTSHYELHNISKQTVPNPVKIYLEQLSSDDQEIRKAACLSSSKKPLIEYDPNDQENNKNIKISDSKNGGSIIEYTVNVPPNDYIESTFEYSMNYSKIVYDCQHTKYPIIDLNINAVFPSGYTFEIHPFLSNELKIISQGDTHKSYRIEGGVLPRQGIIYKLEKIS